MGDVIKGSFATRIDRVLTPIVANYFTSVADQLAAIELDFSEEEKQKALHEFRLKLQAVHESVIEEIDEMLAAT